MVEGRWYGMSSPRFVQRYASGDSAHGVPIGRESTASIVKSGWGATRTATSLSLVWPLRWGAIQIGQVSQSEAMITISPEASAAGMSREPRYASSHKAVE